MIVRCLFLVAGMLGVGAWAGLDLAEIQRAKAATVLVESGLGRSFGSGFCIGRDGYVLTNYHVIDDAVRDFRVVLHPGEPGQEVVEARAVRQDRNMDLALLLLSGVKGPLVPLEMGDTTRLVETAPLTAFGFPFGKSLAVARDAYPSVSVNTGKVTSLRRSADGALREIQMDALVNPGNSGGPVLDEKGKVVGITVGGIPGSGVNFAIPVDLVRSFLSAPDLTVGAVPEVDWENRFAPVSLQVKAVSLVPSRGKVTCEVALASSAILRPMTVAETVPGSEWTATAPLLAAPAPNAPTRVQIEAGDTIVTSLIPNRAIGCRHALAPAAGWNLRELAEIVPGKSLVCQDGTSITEEGLKITGLDPLSIRVGSEDVTIPVRAVTRLRVLDKEEIVHTVDYRVTIARDGEAVARRNGTICIRSSQRPPAAVFPRPGEGMAMAEAEASPFPALLPAAATEGVSDVKLPAPYTDCIRAGCGRYLLLTMPSLKKLAVVDLAERSVTGYVPLAESDALVAGGRNYIFVASPTSGLLDRWTIDPLERDRRATLPLAGKLYSLTMGAGCDGPLLVTRSAGNEVVRAFVDGQTLAPVTVKVAGRETFSSEHLPFIRAADCGAVFGSWLTALSPTGLQVEVLADGELKVTREHTSVGHVVPGPDGERIYTGTCGVFTRELVKVPDCPSDIRCFLPSSHPAYYLGLAMPGAEYMRGGDTRIAVCVRGLPVPVLTLPTNQDVVATNAGRERDALSFDKRYHLVPQLRLLAVLPSTNDVLRIYSVDVERTLRDRQVDFLYVESVPPVLVRKGTALHYQIVAKTSAETVSYKLDSGPQGMSVSPSGEVVWEVPPAADAGGGVIVSLTTGDGQNLLHAFNLKIVP